ncbi:glycosyltransferase [Halochromatium glycolicum]|nr:glycosyltransferase [Halochromatium glycolicum]
MSHEGGGHHQMALMRGWRRAGLKVRMIAPRRHPSRVVTADHIVRSWAPSRLSGIPGILDAIPQMFYIVTERWRNKAATLYVRANALTFLQVSLARLLGMFTVVEHNSWLASERRSRGGGSLACWVEGVFQVWSARMGHLSRCVTPGIGMLLRDAGTRAEKIIVIGNGTDLDHFSVIDRDTAMRATGLDPGVTWLGFIGLLSPWQGVETAIAALPTLLTRYSVGLVIAGDGPERARLEQRVRDLNLQDNVIFLGWVNRDDANTVINAFDIALAPFTRRRNAEIGVSALKLRDYAAAGRFVVASDIPGVRDLSETGWLFTHEPDNAADLARAVTSVLEARHTWPEARQRARAHAEAHFGWDVIADGLAERLVARKRRL